MKTTGSILGLLALSFGLSAQTFVGTQPTNKNVVLEEFTGINCVHCPDGHRIANLIAAGSPGRVVLINVHAGGFSTPGAGEPDFRTTYGSAMNSAFNVTSYPAGMVNRGLFGGTTPVTGRGNWTSRANTILGQSSPVNVAARSSIDLSTREVTVTVEVYYTANAPGSTNKLHVLMLQNNIAGPQTGASSNPSAVLPDGSYNHQHALRYGFTTNAGTDIPTTTAGSFHSFNFTYTLPASIVNIPVTIPDLEIVAYVSENNQNILSGNKSQINFIAAANNSGNLANTASAETMGASCGSSAMINTEITNTGGNSINEVTLSYTVNGGAAQTVTQTLTSPIPTANRATISFAVAGLSTGNNNIQVTLTQINGVAITGATAQSVSVRPADFYPNATQDSATFTLRFDNYASETGWTFRNETTGAIVASGGGYGAAQNATTLVRRIGLTRGHCYSLRVTDAASDGIWSTQYGMGAFYLQLDGGTMVFADSVFTASTSKKFTYGSTGSAPTASFNAPANTNICAGANLSFTNASTGATTYFWSFPGGTPSSSTQTSPANITYMTPGVYDVILVATNSTGSVTSTQSNQVTVTASPVTLTPSITAASTASSSDGSISLQAGGGTAPYTYLWNMGATGSTLSGVSAGNYSVVVRDANGCIASSSFAVSVGTVNTIAQQTLQAELKLFPNPVSEQLNLDLQLTQEADLQLQVVNNLGQVVMQQELGQTLQGGHNLQVSVRDLPNGSYALVLRAGAKLMTQRFTVLR